ncbi:MAG: efflux RND transporter permease subunit [Treponemataceae bacterium]
MKKLWYARPVAALCFAMALIAVSVAAIIGRSGCERKTGKLRSYSITQRYYGMDARELERLVAVPLEDALSAVLGARDIVTTSEYGMVRASVRIESGAVESYGALREAAQTVYEKLPRAAQRPEIYAAEDGRAPVWIAAVTAASDLDRLMEKEIKPAFERINGVGEVEAAGTGMPEIALLVDEEKAANAGIDALVIARFLAENDALYPAGVPRDSDVERIAVLDARYPTVDLLRGALIRDGASLPISLASISRVEERSRKPETRSRVNGKAAVVLSITASSDTDEAALSRALKSAVVREIERLTAFGVDFRVLSDRGAEREASFASTLGAAAQGTVAVAVTAAILSSGAALSVKIISALAVPFVLLVSAAFLSLAGFPLDRLSMAGLAAGLGAAVDAIILVVERIASVADAAEKRRRIRNLAPPLIAGAATTLATLIPIASMDSFVAGSSTLAVSVGATTVVALAVSFFLLPPLIGARRKKPLDRFESELRALKKGAPAASLRISVLPHASLIFRRARRIIARLLAFNATVCARRPLIPLLSAVILTLGAAVSLAIVGTDSVSPSEGNAVYVHLEFERGATTESVDDRLSKWGTEAAALTGVLNAQTSAKPGSGTALVSFDSGKTDRRLLSEAIRALPVPGGFAFLPETTSRDRLWEIVVSGDDDRVCRSLATSAARALGEGSFAKDVVLNFKDGSERLLLVPDRQRLALAGLSFSSVADSLRRSVYGPPAYKRLDEKGEIDVRVGSSSAGEKTAADLARLPVRSEKGVVRLGEVMKECREGDVGRVIRKDRRPVAVITLRTDPMDPRRAKEVAMEALKSLRLPPLYAIEFDREAVNGAEKLSGTVLLFLLALLLSYLVLASVTESFTAPLVALSTVPPSLAVPAIVAAICAGAVSAATACAFVAVSGMAVNASVLTVDERRKGGSSLKAAGPLALYRLTRSRFSSLAATCLIAVIGSLPLLFLSDAGNATARSLAFVSALGVGASFIASLTIVPALAAFAPRLFDTWKHSSHASDVSAAPGGSFVSVVSAK